MSDNHDDHDHEADDHGHDDHGHGSHGHEAHDDGSHGHEAHDHEHPGGLRGVLRGIFAPHSHDAADSVDSALEGSREGMRALKISLVGLAVTAALQVFIVLISVPWRCWPTRSTISPTP